jgi:hypothetical protein
MSIMKEEYKILQKIWWTPPLNSVLFDALTGASDHICIGLVAIESFKDGSWKCYIGYGQGKSEDEDCQRIAANGMPLGNKSAACAFFPMLDPDRFKY